MGFNAGQNVTTASNVICIGDDVFGANVSNTCFIGNIHSVNEGGTGILPVYINNTDQLGTVASSRRFKKEIKPMDKASEAILRMKPVTFHYKSDDKGTPQFGLIAEEVADVNPDLVVHDKNGEIYAVRYDAVNAMLLNEFLKEYRKVEQQRTHFEAALAKQQKQIEALTTGLEKVNAQLQLQNSPAQTVVKNQ